MTSPDSAEKPSVSFVDPKTVASPVSPGAAVLKPGLIYAALVVLLVLIAGGYYFFWQQLILRDQQLSEFQQQVESAERQQDKFLQQSKEDQQALQTLLQEQLAQFDIRIEKLSSTDRSDWLLAETEYLLRMANQYATLAHDARAAEALLANADQIMRELEKNIAAGKSVVNIRSKISEERAALKLRSELDREGLYLQLDAFIKQIDKIPVVDISSMARKSQVAEQEIAVHETSISKRMLASLLRALEKVGGYIRVQKHDQEIGLLLSPDEQQYLKQNLRFRLEQAQIALLQQHQAIYQNSLSDGKEWVKKYYVIDPSLKNKLLMELDSYSKYDVEEPLPDISASLNALKEYIQTRHSSHGK